MYASSSSCTFQRPGQESTYDAVLIYIHSLYRKKKYFHRWISIDSRIYENDAKKKSKHTIFFSNSAKYLSTLLYTEYSKHEKYTN